MSIVILPRRKERRRTLLVGREFAPSPIVLPGDPGTGAQPPSSGPPPGGAPGIGSPPGLGGRLPPGAGGPNPGQGRGRGRDQTGAGGGGGGGGSATLFTWFDAPTMHEHTGINNDWADRDAPIGTPDGSPGLLIYIYPKVDHSSGCGFRAKGSSATPGDFRGAADPNGSHYIGFTALDSDRKYQTFGRVVSGEGMEWSVLAAVNPGMAHMFTDPPSLGTVPTTWEDYDISAHVQGSDECLAAIVHLDGLSGTSRRLSIRKKGWTITNEGAIRSGFAVVPVDDDNVFQAQTSDAADVPMLLLGYIKAGITVPESQPTAITLSGAGTYHDLPALPSGAEGGIYWWGRPSSGANVGISVRPKGATAAPFTTVRRGQGANSLSAVVRGGDSNAVEAQVANTALVGYLFATIDAEPE